MYNHFASGVLDPGVHGSANATDDAFYNPCIRRHLANDLERFVGGIAINEYMLKITEALLIDRLDSIRQR